VTYNTAIVLLGAMLLGALCGVVGSFAVLRRRALLGDAIAHAALPGIGLAFLITQSKSLPVLLCGALATGLFGVWVVASLRRYSRTKDDAAIGLVLSVFFGAGIALSRFIQNEVKDGSQAGLDTYLLGKTAGIVRQDVIVVAIVCAACLAVVTVLFKELRLVSFDPEFARSMGWNTLVLDFLAMGLLAAAVVVGLPMVGIVLVAALTILPAVAARFWTESLAKMLWIAAFVGALSALLGTLVSASAVKLPTGPLVIMASGALFLVSALLAPNRGVLSTWFRAWTHRLEHSAELSLRLMAEHRVPMSQAAGFLKSQGVYQPQLALAYAGRKGLLKHDLPPTGKELPHGVD
jgi:manganese/zinc/iron transport system permease protein